MRRTCPDISLPEGHLSAHVHDLPDSGHGRPALHAGERRGSRVYQPRSQNDVDLQGRFAGNQGHRRHLYNYEDAAPVINEDEVEDDDAYEEDPEDPDDAEAPEMLDGDDAEDDADDDLGDTADSSDATDDDLYDQAVSIVRMENKATVSLLQRRLNVGYARAARIMELLEENGIVGPFAGSNPREVLPADEPDDVEGSDDE